MKTSRRDPIVPIPLPRPRHPSWRPFFLSIILDSIFDRETTTTTTTTKGKGKSVGRNRKLWELVARGGGGRAAAAHAIALGQPSIASHHGIIVNLRVHGNRVTINGAYSCVTFVACVPSLHNFESMKTSSTLLLSVDPSQLFFHASRWHTWHTYSRTNGSISPRNW